jgi:hypothetical protein
MILDVKPAVSCPKSSTKSATPFFLIGLKHFVRKTGILGGFVESVAPHKPPNCVSPI